MSTLHNEDSRVKIPALLHLLRLGYTYQTKIGAFIDSRNNIFVEIFKKSISSINNRDYDDIFINELLKEISEITDNDKDKGDHFFNRLTGYHKVKLMDLESPNKNDFRVVTELTFKVGNEEFRPDITIVINGIPLAFIEVKKPNNHNGIRAEFDRMDYRFKVKEFTKFFNQLQVLGFTNNMPYDDNARIKLQGSFYTTPNFKKTSYNNFREEKEIAVNEYINSGAIGLNDQDSIVNYVLSDNNIMSIKTTPEFETNLKPDTYANRFITSVFSKERLIFIIRYGLVSCIPEELYQ